MGDILWHIDLIPRLNCDVMLKFVTVIDCAFTFQKVSNRLDTLVVMDLCLGTRRHRQHIQTDLFCSDRLLRYSGSISKALLADIGLTGLNHSHCI
ncbi:hypothetical protein AC628_36490 [Bradyrhizobium sp. NAS96.2]|nr:hypothetical protein AC628_36490 [Bradyrhizobium sp. NAS96.2]